MPVHLRKLIGAFALFVLVMVWALLAMAVAQFPAIRDNAYLGGVLCDCGPGLAFTGDGGGQLDERPAIGRPKLRIGNVI